MHEQLACSSYEVLSFLDLDECLSFRSDLPSIWRIVYAITSRLSAKARLRVEPPQLLDTAEGFSPGSGFEASPLSGCFGCGAGAAASFASTFGL
jgi:hypothetical protein